MTWIYGHLNLIVRRQTKFIIKMTATLISLTSIIIGANLTGFIFGKYSFGLIGNTIAGVSGSILFIEYFGRLGFDPVSIMQTGTTNFSLFFLNCFVSLSGGAIAIVLMKKLKRQ